MAGVVVPSPASGVGACGWGRRGRAVVPVEKGRCGSRAREHYGSGECQSRDRAGGDRAPPLCGREMQSVNVACRQLSHHGVRVLVAPSGPGYEREPRRRAIGSPGLPSQPAHRSRCAVAGDQLSRTFARLSESVPPVSGSHAAGNRLLPASSDSLVMTLAGYVRRRAASCLAVVGVEPGERCHGEP